MPQNKHAISVMSVDRVGIISAVTGAIFRIGGNIDRISQTVVDGCFIIMVTASFPDGVDSPAVREAIATDGCRFDLEVNVRPYHEPSRQPEADGQTPAPKPRSNIYFLSVTGNDRPGIFHEMTAVLAGRGVNILDLYCFVRDDMQFVLLGEVDLPAGLDLEQLRIDLESGREKEALRIRIQHENLFRATNELYIARHEQL